jgi:hypothetical protein
LLVVGHVYIEADDARACSPFRMTSQ